MTILTIDDLFSFCTFEYAEAFSLYSARAAERIAHLKEHHTLEDEPGRDDSLYMTAIPWVSFTAILPSVDLSPADSVPRFAWGKFFEDGETLKMPLNVQVHHGLLDDEWFFPLYAECTNDTFRIYVCPGLRVGAH